MQAVQWKKIMADISLPQERVLGFLKKKYSLLLSYTVEVSRPKSTKEQTVEQQHQATFKQLEKQFPIVEERYPFELPSPPTTPIEKRTAIVVFQKVIVQDVEVSKAVFEQFKDQKKFPLKYNIEDPYQIKY